MDFIIAAQIAIKLEKETDDAFCRNELKKEVDFYFLSSCDCYLETVRGFAILPYWGLKKELDFEL